MNKKIALGASLIVMASIQYARASYDPAVVQAVNNANTSIVQAVNNANKSITGAVNTSSTNDVNALRNLSGQNTINSQAVVQAMGNIATTQDERNVVMHVQQATLGAENQATSGTSACNVITGTLAGQALQAEIAQYQEQGTQAQLAYDMGGDRQTPSPSYTGAEAAEEAIIESHCKYDATQADVEAGLCPAVTAPPSSQPGVAGAVAATVPPDVNGNNFINPQNGVVSQKDANAQNNFIALAFNPSPMGAMTPGSAATQKGQKVAYNRLVIAAKQSIPDSIVQSILATRHPFQNSNQQVTSGTVGGGAVSATQFANAMMKDIVGVGPEPSGGYFPNGVSLDAMLELRAKGWYMNPNWSVALNTDSQISAIKDLTMIEAFRAYLQDRQYTLQQNEAIELADIDQTLHEMAEK